MFEYTSGAKDLSKSKDERKRPTDINISISPPCQASIKAMAGLLLGSHSSNQKWLTLRKDLHKIKLKYKAVLRLLSAFLLYENQISSFTLVKVITTQLTLLPS